MSVLIEQSERGLCFGSGVRHFVLSVCLSQHYYDQTPLPNVMKFGIHPRIRYKGEATYVYGKAFLFASR